MFLKNLNLIKYDFIVSIIFLSLLIKIENVLAWTILALLSLTTLVLLDRKKKIKGINENNKFILYHANKNSLDYTTGVFDDFGLATETGAPLFDVNSFPFDQTGELLKVSDNTGSTDLVFDIGTGNEIVTTRNVPPYENGHGNGFALITDEISSQKLIAYTAPSEGSWSLFATLWQLVDGVYKEIF